MRVAFISDIHANISALNAVLNDARENGAEKFIFLGDYIFDLPFSNDVVELLRGLRGAHFIKGNKETYLMKMTRQDQDGWVYEQLNALYYIYRTLSSDNFSFLSGLGEEAYIKLTPDCIVYMTHKIDLFHSHSDGDKVNALSAMFRERRHKLKSKGFAHDEYLTEFGDMINKPEAVEYFNQINADIIAFGHDHLQGYGYSGGKLIVNPGSCGQPLDFNTAAPYTIVDIEDGSFTVTEKRVPYDLDAVIRETGQSELYRHAKIWCELCILALRMARDYYGLMFKTMDRIGAAKNETALPRSNETYREAYEEFKKILNDMEA
jgi:predicted phosphodiesterase